MGPQSSVLAMLALMHLAGNQTMFHPMPIPKSRNYGAKKVVGKKGSRKFPVKRGRR